MLDICAFKTTCYCINNYYWGICEASNAWQQSKDSTCDDSNGILHNRAQKWIEEKSETLRVRFLKIVISIICSHVSLSFLYMTHVNKYIPRFLIIFNFGNITKRFILL